MNKQLIKLGVTLMVVLGLLSVGQSVSAATPKTLLLTVPFTAQAPLGEWRYERQQDGCEEAVALMARAWVKPAEFITKKAGSTKSVALTKSAWRDKIVALSDWELKKYGEYRDVSLSDMQAWIFRDYFADTKTQIKTIKSANDLVKLLGQGQLILAPMNGRALHNPNFTAPGPERHMILIKGYDYGRQEFITNDPGTRRGENYRYSSSTIFKAIRPYRTGNKLPFGKPTKEVLVVSR
jgi:hypothetical protein